MPDAENHHRSTLIEPDQPAGLDLAPDFAAPPAGEPRGWPPTGVTSLSRVERQNHRFVLVLLGATLLASVLWQPPDQGGWVICGLRAFAGTPCAGCGLTRSFCALGHGDLDRAFQFHRVGPPLYALAVIFWVRSAWILLRGRVRDWRLGKPTRWVLAALLLMMANWGFTLYEIGESGAWARSFAASPLGHWAAGSEASVRSDGKRQADTGTKSP